jgi:hypothetical protein
MVLNLATTMMSPRHAATHLTSGVPMRFNGEDIELQPGETAGEAYKRHMANKAKPATELAATPATKPAGRKGMASKLKFGQSFRIGKPTKPAA